MAALSELSIRLRLLTMRNNLLLIMLSLSLTACSTLPESIKKAPEKQLSLIEATGEAQKGTDIRWGGEVVLVENKENQSLLEIVAYPLNHYGKPKTSELSQGRFVARTTEFYDPQVYKKGTLITVSGKVAGSEKRKVDERSILMPVIDMAASHKWRAQQTYHRDPFYDPFYSPYSPYHSFYGGYGRYPRFGYRFYHH